MHHSAIEKRFDVVVIGSGFGGAAVACRLAQAGSNVGILERGKRYPIAPGPNEPERLSEHFQIDEFKTFKVIRGKGVGGGSLHYYNVRLRTPAEVFDNGRWPREITRERLDPYYDLVNGMLPASPLEPHPNFGDSGYPVRSLAFIEAAEKCERCQQEPEFMNIAVHSTAEPANTPAGIPQTACVFCGECIIGCPPSDEFDGNVNARARLDLNYLAVAEQHNAQIFANHTVRSISKSYDGFEIHTEVTDPDSEEVLESGVVRATQVVLAAGSLGSTEILLRSGGLPFTSERLGHYYSGNGDFLIPKTKHTTNNLEPDVGPTITVGADFSTEKHIICIQDLGKVSFLQDKLNELHPNLAEALEPFELGQHVMHYLGMGNDAANGCMELCDDKLEITWNPSDSLELYNDITAALEELSTQLGGKYKPPRGYDPQTGTGLLTAHPLGGCPMGEDEREGVVNPQGEVYGVPGLYVADGAIIPSALSVNPSYTISALAERVAFWMVHGREMTECDPYTPHNR